METTNKGNEAYRPVRLTLRAVSREFGRSLNFYRSHLRDTQPGEDGCYSIRQVVDTIYEHKNDSIQSLKAKVLKEQGEHWEMRNQQMRGELLDRSKVEQGLTALVSATIQVIKGSNLSKRDQNDILQNLAECSKVLDSIAREQAKEMSVEQPVEEAPVDEG